jgi:general stress protein 26
VDKQKQKILDFISLQDHAVLSYTDSDNNSHGAYIGFAETDDLRIVFGTDSKSLKFTSVISNPRVALTFSQGKVSIQYEGKAQLIKASILEKYKSVYLKKKPGAIKYDQNPDNVYFLVDPKWIRYMNHNEEPHEIYEVKFD